METPTGTPVGVADPYDAVDRCDHLTDRGRCRLAIEQPDLAPAFARDRARDDYRCPAADPAGEWAWRDCPQLTARARPAECARCGLPERRMAHDDDRPLLQEHHLMYPDDTRLQGSHEISVALCRWCHAKIHHSWAGLDDDVSPDPEAIAALEGRRSRELDELGFRTAAERRDRS